MRTELGVSKVALIGVHRFPARLSLVLSGLALGSCFPETPEPVGACVVVPETTLPCSVTVGEEVRSAGLVGYQCSGGARPDLDATYDEGFPKGTMCADKGLMADGVSVGYCCTPEPVDCAYDPVSDCDAHESGYACRGANRPESLNPAITCGNGIRFEQITEYCCTGMPVKDGCEQSDVAGCSGGLLGFLCEVGAHPRGEQLGSNKSRPDHFNFTCATPQSAPNPKLQTTCCFAPPKLLDGASCINHTAVPGCAAGRFGFACYGPDTPEDAYLAMSCPEAGFEGASQEGYPATLYCCDFKE